MDDFEESLIAFPAVRRLRALVPRGLDAVHKTVRRALADDDYSLALREANARYARRGIDDYVSTLTYACLLVGRELVVEARGLLDKAVEAHGPRPALVALSADAHLLEGDVDRARAQLDTIAVDDLEEAAIASFVADVRLDLGDEDEAIAFYQRALDRRVDDPEPAIRLGQLYLGRDQLRPAAEAYQYAAELAKGRTGLWQATADMWFELGEAVRGYQARRRVLELSDAAADEWLELGYGLAGVGRLEDALDALSKAERLDPFSIDALLVRGHIFLATSRAEEAMAAFQKVEHSRDDYPTVARGMAEAALLIGDLTLAKEKAERAVELDADDPEAHHVLGRTLQQFGRHDAALESLGRAVELDARQAVYLAARALSLGRLGRLDEAADAVQAAVELAEADPAQLPLRLDADAWKRLEARLDEADWARLSDGLDRLQSADAE